MSLQTFKILIIPGPVIGHAQYQMTFVTSTKDLDYLPPECREVYGPSLSLSVHEKCWACLQPMLETKGYMLRPRYRPGWVGSWISKDTDPLYCEDSVPNPTQRVMDATRMADNTQVMLKMLPQEDNTAEVLILKLMSSDPFASDPRNHCIALLDIFTVEDPDVPTFNPQIVVFPFFRKWQMPPLLMTEELMSLVRQLLEGLVFLHSNNIAHRDIERPNILMDARGMYPRGFHGAYNYNESRVDVAVGYQPPMFTRLQVPVKYYYSDFGLSSIFPSVEDRQLVQFQGGLLDRFPEIEADEDALYDPFKADIYALGMMLKGEFLDFRRGPEFLRPLLLEMTERDPNRRPTAEECFAQFDKLSATVPFWRRLTYIGFSRSLHWRRRLEMWSSYLQLLWQAVVSNNRCRY